MKATYTTLAKVELVLLLKSPNVACPLALSHSKAKKPHHVPT
jgi:hypothetical protein